MQIFEYHDQRLIAGEHLEKPASRPEDLFWRRADVGQAKGTGKSSRKGSSIALGNQKSPDLLLRFRARVLVRDLCGILDHLGQRPVGDPLTVGETAAAKDGCAVLEASDQLTCQA